MFWQTSANTGPDAIAGAQQVHTAHENKYIIVIIIIIMNNNNNKKKLFNSSIIICCFVRSSE